MQKTVLCSPFCWPWPQKSHRLSSPLHGVKGLKCKLSSQCLSSERSENKCSQGTSISSNAPKKAAKSSWTAIWKQLVWAHPRRQPQNTEISSQFRLQTYPSEHFHGRMYEKCLLIFACIGQTIAYITPWKLHYRKWLTLWSMFAECFCGMSSALPSVIARGVPSVDLGDPQITGSQVVRWWTNSSTNKKPSQTLTKRWSRPGYHSGHTCAMLRQRRNCRILGNTDFRFYCAAALQTANKVAVIHDM